MSASTANSWAGRGGSRGGTSGADGTRLASLVHRGCLPSSPIRPVAPPDQNSPPGPGFVPLDGSSLTPGPRGRARWPSPRAAARAAPPANDLPSAAFGFAPYTAANGVPVEQQAIAELAEATPDPALLRCLGEGSFERTVWFFAPRAAVATEITVDAAGRTLDPVDLAAFVQPEVLATPPATAAQGNASVPNACAGIGDGGASGAIEPGNAVRCACRRTIPSLPGRPPRRRRPAGRRARRALAARPRDPHLPARSSATARSRSRPSPAPSARRRCRWPTRRSRGRTRRRPSARASARSGGGCIPGDSVPRRITVTGRDATSLAVFTGALPAEGRALECLNRDDTGPMEMIVPVRKGRTTWIRVGHRRARRPARHAEDRTGRPARPAVVDGGPGGDDPTPGGPGGGLPGACDRPETERARIAGPRLRARPAATTSRACRSS